MWFIHKATLVTLFIKGSLIIGFWIMVALIVTGINWIEIAIGISTAIGILGALVYLYSEHFVKKLLHHQYRRWFEGKD